MVKVSIIMPVYNSETYLKTAVDSVLEQDFSDFELILVDDGSPDQSGKICDEYAALNSKVEVIHKPNGGICSARNAGLEMARGEYIGFCDNDDLYLPGLIKDNYELAKKNNVDLMRYAKIKRLEKDDGRIWEIFCKIEDMFIEKKDFHKYYDNIRREDTVWTAFYRREIIEKYHIRFDEQFKYGSEDLNFNLRFLMFCDKLGFNSKVYYSWTQRDSHSTSRNFKKDFLDKKILNLQLEYDFISNVCEDKVNNIVKNIFLVNSYIYPMIDYMSIKNCAFSLNDKAKYLELMRNHPIFDKMVPHDTLKYVRKTNKRVYLTMKLFYERNFKTLVVIINKGTKLLALFRFKEK